MRRTLWTLLLTALAITSCMVYRDDRTSFRWRSENFQKLLGENAVVEAFKAGRTAEVAAHIERKKAADPAFAKAYLVILEAEGIKLFTAQQTADYFYTAIHLKIGK